MRQALAIGNDTRGTDELVARGREQQDRCLHRLQQARRLEHPDGCYGTFDPVPAWRAQFDVRAQFPPCNFIFITIIIMRQHFTAHAHWRHGLLTDFPCGNFALAQDDHQLCKGVVPAQG